MCAHSPIVKTAADRFVPMHQPHDTPTHVLDRQATRRLLCHVAHLISTDVVRVDTVAADFLGVIQTLAHDSLHHRLPDVDPFLLSECTAIVFPLRDGWHKVR